MSISSQTCVKHLKNINLVGVEFLSKIYNNTTKTTTQQQIFFSKIKYLLHDKQKRDSRTGNKTYGIYLHNIFSFCLYLSYYSRF